VIFLTFDDGPIPDLTPYVLEKLKEFGVYATFFCVGDNVFKFPEIFKKIMDHGHAVGNHTFNHLKAWTSEPETYMENVRKCNNILVENGAPLNPALFRPPYGQITAKLIRTLKQEYQIIMWDILSYDFSTVHSPEQSLEKIIRLTRPGSIVVFHDNNKAEEKLKYILPRYLHHFTELGYSFKKLSAD
jgi:peptidoglycan/xylan/chitin deacetylase (PgdA/CDA1 family)